MSSHPALRAALPLALMLLLSLGAASAGAVVYAPVDQPGPALSVPAAELQASLKCTDDVRNAARQPVLLLPATGVDSDHNFAWNYERAFAQLGIPYCTSDQPGADASNMNDIQTRAEYVTYAIRQTSALAGRPIAVMGHSQGGMVMRWSLRFWPDTRPLVQDVIGMAGSNHGTKDAEATCATGCAPAVWQQRDDSQFTAALNSYQETFAGIDYTEIYTHNDEVVTPNGDSNGSSSVHGTQGRIANVAIQDVCPADPSEHLAVGTQDATAYALVMDALTHDGPADPKRIDPAVCTQTLQPGIDQATYPANLAAATAALATGFGTAPSVSAEPPLRCYVLATCAGGNAGTPVGAAGTTTVRPRAVRRRTVRHRRHRRHHRPHRR